MIHIQFPPPELAIQHWDELYAFMKLAVDHSNGELDEVSCKNQVEDRLLSDRGVIPISECECVHVICPNKFIGRFKEMHERYGVEVG